MRRFGAKVMLAGAMAAACSGRYEVGQMDLPQPVASAGASPGDGMIMVMKGYGGAGGSDELGPTCVPAGMPEPPVGQLATPEVVWERLSPLVWGKVVEPPGALPQETTADWASAIANQAWDQAVDERGGAPPGASAFLRTWLRYPDGVDVDARVLEALSAEVPALHVLLTTELADARRTGVFTEQRWLAAYPAISTRGFVMLQALFGIAIPPEPGGLDNDIPPAEGISRREQIAVHVSNVACASCHALFDPLGLSLEHFDAEGSYRDSDGGKPVDASGTYELRQGERVITFEDIEDLGAQLEGSCAANLGLAAEYWRLARGAPESQTLTPELEADRARVQRGFIHGGRSYRALLRAYARSAAVLLP